MSTSKPSLPEIMEWSTALHRAHLIGTTVTTTTGTPNPTRTVPVPENNSGNNADSYVGHGLDKVTTALVNAASKLAITTDRLADARTLSASSSTKAWERQPKFLQDQILCLMATHDDDTMLEPTQSLTTFLSLSSNTSAAQHYRYMSKYLHSVLLCQDLRLDPFTSLCISQLQLNYDPTEGPSQLSLLKLLSKSNSMVASSDQDIIANATIDSSGDGTRFEQTMKQLSDKKLSIVAKNKNFFETTIRNMIAMVIFVLGRCYTSDRLCSWLQHLETNPSSYRHCHKLDPKFFAHQLIIMDNMIQAFWRNASHAKKIADMDFHLLDFAQQQRQIAMCNPMTTPLHPRVSALFPTPSSERPRLDHNNYNTSTGHTSNRSK